jgi:beta-carotene/zeaxanthin 4-ketolase
MFSFRRSTVADDRHWGGWMVGCILGLWALSLGGLLGRSFDHGSIAAMLGAIAIRTFLQTGLFIMAHEAMHHNLIPQSDRVNHHLGQFCVLLYGFLDYAQCRRNHRLHHQIPAQVGDPDFHDGIHPHPIAWYWHFLRGYLTGFQFLGFTVGWLVIFGVGTQVCHWPITNILWFWFLPLILSSMQLFVFGTYLPHRQGQDGEHQSRVAIDAFSIWRSLLSCYHFGTYHWAHHASPKTPWYSLPTVAMQMTTAESKPTLMRHP